MIDETPQLRQVLHPVSDVAAAVSFYSAAFGFAARFNDSDRFSALDAGSVTLALTGPAEDITDGRPAAGLRVPDLASLLRAVVAAGGSVVREAETGPHEERAVVSDPWGNWVVLYAPR